MNFKFYKRIRPNFRNFWRNLEGTIKSPTWVAITEALGEIFKTAGMWFNSTRLLYFDFEFLRTSGTQLIRIFKVIRTTFKSGMIFSGQNFYHFCLRKFCLHFDNFIEEKLRKRRQKNFRKMLQTFSDRFANKHFNKNQFFTHSATKMESK